MKTSKEVLEYCRQQTELMLQKAVGEWQMMDSALLSAAPAPGKWSAAQCMEHVNIYGRHYLPALDAAISKELQSGLKSTVSYKSGWLGQYFANLMQPGVDGTLKSKMTSPKNAEPVAAPDARAMLAEFIDQQEQMLQLLSRAEFIHIGKIRVPITLSPFIRLKAGDTFLFVIAHAYRHFLQADRSINAGKSAASDT